VPLDEIESRHKDEVLAWIDSGADLFRIKKPDTPNKHLVSYFCVIDQETMKILLVEHKNAGLWLASGGHVDIDEHPKNTATRECIEELGYSPKFILSEPLFITSTGTVGLTSGHTDISLWYLVKGTEGQKFKYTDEEFSSVRWFTLDDIPLEKSDPHMQRFITKLKKTLCKDSNNE
jgi:8-oxo-dGTP pyrophosphatase MutT (NUDIX family)